MYMGYDNREDGTYRHLSLRLWFSNGDYLSQSSLGCTANGTKKLPDFAVDPQGGGGTGNIEADTQPTNGERVTYRWQKMDLMFELLWGRRDSLKWGMPKTQPKDTVLSDNPGSDCNLRKDGKVIREILFNVDKNGMVTQDEIQTAKDAIPTVTHPKVKTIQASYPPKSGQPDPK
jgi:hypothetical protein